ncbi:hypothetical protein FE257_009737 [Aspergillus nanangensis]|uniref:Uncharacterized protein n=1 Tax=Aspergillus nanangensis TaxID=2582783 RepID=A0AAD4CJE2_ASPNN|nr:hypothetical protein FE257_009737 [Aspergillus nanangensis]
MTQTDLAGKGALVTGGGSGISLSFVQHLYHAGANVLICDIALHHEAVAWLESIQHSSRVAFRTVDVTDWKQLESAYDEYGHIFGGIPDIVCPGAGIYEPSSPNFWNDQDESFYKMIRINLEHPLKLSRMAIRKFVQTKQPGIIVHVSSTGAQKPSMFTPLYGAAKQGISNFVRCMAGLQDMEDIRVVAVAPGPTMSPLMYDHPEALKLVDQDKDQLCQPDEVGRAMMAVCFDREQFASGTVLEVTHPDCWRQVSLLNDPGPGLNAYTSNRKEGLVAVVAALDADRHSTE